MPCKQSILEVAMQNKPEKVRRTSVSLLVLMIVALCASACSLVLNGSHTESHPTQSNRYFVATNGNDSWSGTFAAPYKERSDGPFRTLNRALQVVADRNRETGFAQSPKPISIYVCAGLHILEEPLSLSPQHSGSTNAPLVIAAFPNTHPVISAGKRITGWYPTNVSGQELWATPIPDARQGNWFFHQLWINGERRTRARHPNKGYLAIAGLPDATPTWEHGNKRFQFGGGDLKNLASATNGDAVVMTRWVESRLPITAIDEEQHILTSNKKTVFQLQPGDPYYVEHIFEALDEPGEWYLNRREGTLYYMPLPGEQIDAIEAFASKLPECLRIEGHPETGDYVENVEFRGLTFSHNEWFYPTNFGSTERHISTTPDPEIFGSAQAAFVVPGAVRAEGARHCSFVNCRFANVGSYGLQLGRGCQSNRVERCEFVDLAGGGIRLGETLVRDKPGEQPCGNEVSNCHIHDGGKLFHSGEGIWIGQSFGNRLSHNLIHDFFYTGISIGWTWGYEGTLATNNIVEFNHVHHIGKKSNGDGPILSDMGAIYTLGIQPGTIIRSNLWHDISGLRYGGWGIYLDEGSSHIAVENNVVYNTTHGGFHQHYGKENIIRNNVFAFGRDAQLQRTRPEDHASFTFERNIVYFNNGKLLEGDWSNGKFNQDNNIYFDTRTNGPGLNFPGGWENWPKAGRDIHSAIADPLFVSTNLANVSFNAGSKAFDVGFKPFHLNMVGPLQSEP